MTKKAILVIALCLLSIPGAAADNSGDPRQQVESIIASIPTENEWKAWSELPNKQGEHMSPSDIAFAKRISDSRANIKSLDSLIVVGKSISDYPGILSLGVLAWDREKRIYTLFVRYHVDYMDIDPYLGFRCWFNNSMIITRKESAIHGF